MTLRGPYRWPSTPFKLQLCQDIRTGVLGRRDAQPSHNLSANLIQLWLTQFDRGELNDEEAEASVIAEYEARIITLELSLRGLLRNFGLKVGAISRGRLEHRIRELTAGNPMLFAPTEPMLRARASLRQELAGLERRVRQLAQDDPCLSPSDVNAGRRRDRGADLPFRS